jgi:hypothetical protein
MKRFTILLSAFLGLAACSRGPRTEERVVELPAGNAKSTLSTASQIGQSLIGGGFFSAVQQHFPALTDQEFQGVFLSWNQGVIGGRKTVFLLTGIRYRGQSEQAKAIANLCEAQVRSGVSNYFESHPEE